MIQLFMIQFNISFASLPSLQDPEESADVESVRLYEFQSWERLSSEISSRCNR